MIDQSYIRFSGEHGIKKYNIFLLNITKNVVFYLNQYEETRKRWIIGIQVCKIDETIIRITYIFNNIKYEFQHDNNNSWLRENVLNDLDSKYRIKLGTRSAHFAASILYNLIIQMEIAKTLLNPTPCNSNHNQSIHRSTSTPIFRIFNDSFKHPSIPPGIPSLHARRSSRTNILYRHPGVSIKPRSISQTHRPQ